MKATSVNSILLEGKRVSEIC